MNGGGGQWCSNIQQYTHDAECRPLPAAAAASSAAAAAAAAAAARTSAAFGAAAAGVTTTGAARRGDGSTTAWGGGSGSDEAEVEPAMPDSRSFENCANENGDAAGPALPLSGGENNGLTMSAPLPPAAAAAAARSAAFLRCAVRNDGMGILSGAGDAQKSANDILPPAPLPLPLPLPVPLAADAYVAFLPTGVAIIAAAAAAASRALRLAAFFDVPACSEQSDE